MAYRFTVIGGHYNVSQMDLTLRATTAGTVHFRLLDGTADLNLAPVGTIQLLLTDQAGGTKTFATGGSGLTVTSAANGSVDLVPGMGDIVAGSAPYRGYFKLHYGVNKWWFCPEDSEFTVRVRP